MGNTPEGLNKVILRKVKRFDYSKCDFIFCTLGTNGLIASSVKKKTFKNDIFGWKWIKYQVNFQKKSFLKSLLWDEYCWVSNKELLCRSWLILALFFLSSLQNQGFLFLFSKTSVLQQHIHFYGKMAPILHPWPQFHHMVKLIGWDCIGAAAGLCRENKNSDLFQTYKVAIGTGFGAQSPVEKHKWPETETVSLTLCKETYAPLIVGRP